ncbi:MAG: hypothetical protein PHG00_15740, partial [Methylococcales bacterium]|nr:hypothetical protein [Methylococcales bacterium]
SHPLPAEFSLRHGQAPPAIVRMAHPAGNAGRGAQPAHPDRENLGTAKARPFRASPQIQIQPEATAPIQVRLNLTALGVYRRPHRKETRGAVAATGNRSSGYTERR